MISTKNIKTAGEGGLPKLIQPGNISAKILDVTLESFKYVPESYHIILSLETEPIEGFEGFAIDKDNLSLGHHKGQIGKVKTNEYAYATATTRTGVEINRDIEMLKFLKNLCTALGNKALKWLDDQDGKHNTIESLFEQFNIDQLYKDVFLNWCVAGKEYTNKNGYKAYELFLPRFEKGKSPFSSEDKKPYELIAFSETTHIKRKESKAVESFGSDNDIDDSFVL